MSAAGTASEGEAEISCGARPLQVNAPSAACSGRGDRRPGYDGPGRDLNAGLACKGQMRFNIFFFNWGSVVCAKWDKTHLMPEGDPFQAGGAQPLLGAILLLSGLKWLLGLKTVASDGRQPIISELCNIHSQAISSAMLAFKFFREIPGQMIRNGAQLVEFNQTIQQFIFQFSLCNVQWKVGRPISKLPGGSPATMLAA